MTENSVTNLSWGRGPILTEWFLEPTCPNSARAFQKFGQLLDMAGDRVTVRIVIHSQPWHLFSSVVSRGVLAASLMDGGRDTAWRVLGAVFENREDFVADQHCMGPNMQASLEDILARIAAHSGVDVGEAFVRSEVTDLVKKHARYSRQNGIHASPTVMIDGLVNDNIGSRDSIEDWLRVIDPK